MRVQADDAVRAFVCTELCEKGEKMITLTKLNKDPFVLNHNQIQLMESIPETKIVTMNGEFFLVRESIEEVISKIIDFQSRIYEASGVMIVKKPTEVRD